MCLNSEVILLNPDLEGFEESSKRVAGCERESWKTQQDPTWQCRNRKAGLNSGAESWTQLLQECEHPIMFINNFPIFAFPSF